MAKRILDGFRRDGTVKYSEETVECPKCTREVLLSYIVCGDCYKEHREWFGPMGATPDEDANARRESLAQEIRGVLKARGLWAPERASDLIGAVALALDNAKNGK